MPTPIRTIVNIAARNIRLGVRRPRSQRPSTRTVGWVISHIPPSLRTVSNATLVKRMVRPHIKRLLAQRAALNMRGIYRTRGRVITNNHNVNIQKAKIQRKINRLRGLQQHAKYVQIGNLPANINKILRGNNA